MIKTFPPVRFTSFTKPNTSLTILDLNKGDMFGEDKYVFNRKNKNSIKVNSMKATYLQISNFNFEKTF